jgi:Asp-tRNA(Asn)/Glu-tRNA(Gln) amidotransferase A subunit family amidase
MSDTDLTTLTASAAAAELARGTFSAEDYMRACLERIVAIEGEIGAFAHLDVDYAMAQAREMDRHRLAGGRLGVLHGVPVAIKDIIDTADYPTECGSPMLAGRRPAKDAHVVARLRAAGAIIIGKTVTTEFAYFHPGKTRNPHDTSRTPGGSSSGSAAAVAAGMVPLAIGSQTNGSLIRPAAFCGVYTLKPTHGLVSRTGALTLSASLDHIGGFARSLDDLALLMDVIAGHDAEDEDSFYFPSASFRANVAERPPIEPTFALVRTPMWDRADADARAGLEALAAKLNAREVELPESHVAAWDGQRAIMAVEMAHNLGIFVDRGGEVSQQFRDLIEEGRRVPATQYLAAKRDAKRYAAGMVEVFEQLSDAVLTLSARGVAPEGTATGDPVFCTFWSLTGLPALNLPILQSADELPIGVQLVGNVRGDERLMRNAAALIRRAQS